MFYDLDRSLPTIRWNIGDVHNDGISCLNLATRSSRKLSNRFNRVAVANTINFKSDIPVINSEWLEKFNIIPNRTKMLWKWCSPRLNIHSHEIIFDNDVVMFNHHEAIEAAISSDAPTIGRGWRHLYGSVSSYVSAEYPICAGIVILPPGYDIAERLLDNWLKLGKPPLSDPLDEQGLVAYTLLQDGASVLDEGVIPNLVYNQRTMKEITNYTITGNECGYHFIGANRGTNLFLGDFLRNEDVHY